MHTRLLVAAVLLSSGLSVLIGPPASWIFLHPFVWAPAFWVLSRVSYRQAFLLGWGGGVGLYLALFYWLPDTVVAFSRLPYALGVATLIGYALLSGLFLAVVGWGFASVRSAAGPAWPLAIAAWFTACEFLAPQIIPFYQATPWFEVTSLFLVVSFTGLSGGTFILILVNSLVCQATEVASGRSESDRPSAVALNAGVAVLLVIGAFAASSYRLTEIELAEAGSGSSRIAIVQTNLYGKALRKLVEREGSAGIARNLVALSQEALESDSSLDAFVWPEGALTEAPGSPANHVVLEFARRSGSEIWTGAGFAGRHRDEARRPFNSAFRIDASGTIDRRYDKNVLIPFGEYAPFTEWLPFLGEIDGLGRYLPGDAFVVYEAADTRFAMLICYEAILPGLLQKAIGEDAFLIVNLTFDGWFGDTVAPHQHLMLVAAQAAQFGVPIIRSTTSGISAFVDARGVITDRTRLFTRDLLIGEVKRVQTPSFYAIHGDWFAWLCMLASAGLLGRSFWLRLEAS